MIDADQGIYTAGSTFKIITAARRARQRRVTPTVDVRRSRITAPKSARRFERGTTRNQTAESTATSISCRDSSIVIKSSSANIGSKIGAQVNPRLCEAFRLLKTPRRDARGRARRRAGLYNTRGRPRHERPERIRIGVDHMGRLASDTEHDASHAVVQWRWSPRPSATAGMFPKRYVVRRVRADGSTVSETSGQLGRRDGSSREPRAPS